MVGFPALQHQALNNSYASKNVRISLPAITALAGAVKSVWVAQFAGTIVSGTMVVDGAFITTALVATMRINTTAVTGGAITITVANSAALANATATPTALNTFKVGDVINFTITGGVNAQSGSLNILVTQTA